MGDQAILLGGCCWVIKPWVLHSKPCWWVIKPWVLQKLCLCEAEACNRGSTATFLVRCTNCIYTYSFHVSGPSAGTSKASDIIKVKQGKTYEACSASSPKGEDAPPCEPGAIASDPKQGNITDQVVQWTCCKQQVAHTHSRHKPYRSLLIVK